MLGFILCLLISPEPRSGAMNYFLHGFGVFLGVIAGVAVMLLVNWIISKSHETQKLKNLKFEFELNIKKIDSWLEQIIKYRNAVNSDTLHLFHEYFDLSRFVTNTFVDMFSGGILYKYLNYDDIGKLQIIFGEFSLVGEGYINKQIQDNIKYEDKEKAVGDVNFWEKKFKAHKRTLQEILGKLK